MTVFTRDFSYTEIQTQEITTNELKKREVNEEKTVNK